MKYCVYRHINQETFETFYVGIGSEKRAYDFNNRNSFWKRYISKHGKPIVYIEAVEIDLAVACEFERELILFFGRRNSKTGSLVNLSDGGDGTTGFNHNAETRKKMSDLKIGKKIPLSTINKIADANRGQKRTSETKAKIGLRSIGRNSKLVLNTESGIFYDSIKSAAGSTNISPVYFQQQLNGIRKNKTSFVLC